jgi:membrane protein implicated in regulation of membrane protease activity
MIDPIHQMQLFYLALFLTGLVLGVYAMIRGVERIGRGHSVEFDAMGRPVGVSRMALSAPTIGAFATVFGMVGYLLLRYTQLTRSAQLGITIPVALTSAVAASYVVRHWAKQAAQHDAVDEKYLLQGHPAQVVAAIAPAAVGEIAYLVGDKRYAAAAQSLDGTPVAVGTEVVIDRVENGVAYVEPWVQVERRL